MLLIFSYFFNLYCGGIWIRSFPSFLTFLFFLLLLVWLLFFVFGLIWCGVIVVKDIMLNCGIVEFTPVWLSMLCGIFIFLVLFRYPVCLFFLSNSAYNFFIDNISFLLSSIFQVYYHFKCFSLEWFHICYWLTPSPLQKFQWTSWKNDLTT